MISFPRLAMLLALTNALAVAAQDAPPTSSTSKDIDLKSAQVLTSAQRRVNASALNAIALDATQLRNTTLDVAVALDKISGVKVRIEGGVGSGAQVNLNGFAGKHVRIFVDGVPMDGASSSFGLGNIPISLASQIEVYKGVVPVELGSDALGGAVNIITDRTRGTHIDASYAFGSFNTHKSSLNIGHTFSSGFTLRANAYQNYSDNNYKVKVKNLNLTTETFDAGETWHRRFHDNYHNEALLLQAGWVNQWWADRLLFGVNLTQERADVQNANLMQIVFGGKYRQSHGITPRLEYQLRNFLVDRLDFRFSAKYDNVLSENVDTVARYYNWEGKNIPSGKQGEGNASMARFRSHTFTTVEGLKYRYRRQHFLSLNHTFTYHNRRNSDAAANAVQQSASAFMRRANAKHIVGAEYKFVPSYTWSAQAMTKFYSTHVEGPVLVQQAGARSHYEEQSHNVRALGYGMAVSYRPNADWQLKFSAERALRLPTVRELFGDGDLEEGAAALRPEVSYNLNVNAIFERTLAQRHLLRVEIGLNNRNVRDFIIREINSKGIAASRNHGKVLGLGADVNLRYEWANRFELNAAYAYQSMRNRERLTTNGTRAEAFNDRVPNVPYSFGNLDAAYHFSDVFGKQSRLSLTYSLDYMARFFRTWRSNGAKLYVPEQLSHNMALTASIKNGRYNMALEANNFTDALLYDNYSLQKPGRSLMLKLRYYFQKR